MRGIAEWNFPAFDDAQLQLIVAGYVVFSPAERDRVHAGFDGRGMTGHEDLSAVGFDLRAALAADLAWICAYAEGVALLDGWHSSLGATAEHAAATALGLPCMTVQRWLDEAPERLSKT
jgi:hypothetical protein